MSSEKNSKTKEQFYNNDFRKVVVYIELPPLRFVASTETRFKRGGNFYGCFVYHSIPGVLHDLPTSKCKSSHTIDLTMLAYENHENSIKFAQANNSDLLRALKNLMETWLNRYYTHECVMYRDLKLVSAVSSSRLSLYQQ